MILNPKLICPLVLVAALSALTGCSGDAGGETPKQLPVTEQQKAQIEQGQATGEPESISEEAGE